MFFGGVPGVRPARRGRVAFQRRRWCNRGGKTMSNSVNSSRRHFLKSSTLATAAAAFPTIIPRHVLGAPGRPGANDRITVGVIGVGFRANLLIDQLPKPGQIAALSDCFLTRAEEAAGKRKAAWDVYQD